MTALEVSVVIPARNYGHYVGEAIESVQSQTVPVEEIVVVDDGSTDDTAQVARRFRGVAVIQIEHRGVGAARNVGVANTGGALLAFLDADDRWHPHKIEAQLEAMTREGVDMCHGFVEEFLSPDVDVAEAAGLGVRPGRHEVMMPSTLLLPRAVFEAIGPFREDREAGAALDWALRLKELGPRSVAPDDAIVYRRIHMTNSGRIGRAAQQREYLAALKRSLDRRRDQAERKP